MADKIDMEPFKQNPESELPNWLHNQIKDALESDSNDAKREALEAVADYFEIKVASDEEPRR